MKFRLITTVWGPRFAELFLRVTVRSLLGEGNIAAFSEPHEASYTIYTIPETAEQLRKSPLFQCLESRVAIDFVLFDRGDIDPAVSTSHWIGWRRGAEIARKNGEIAFFIIADMLYSANTLRRWVGLFEKGYRAIWTSTTQVVLETALTELESRFPPASAVPISIPNHEVIDLALRHLHPIVICMFRDTRRASRHPEVVFGEIAGEGFGQRVIGSHPLCVDPSFFTLTDAFSPLDRFEAIAFEEPTGVGLEPLLKMPDMYTNAARLDSDRISNMGSWLDYYLTPADVLEGMRTHRFSKPGRRNDPAFRRMSGTLSVYASQVRITGAIYRTVRELQRIGCRSAAQIAASAHYAGRLRRHWSIRGPVTVFVPNDGAIAAWGVAEVDALLSVGNERKLTKAVLEHVFAGRQEFAIGDEVRLPAGVLTTSTHRTLVVERPVRVLAGPIQCDDCTIYVIDRVLLALSEAPQRAPAADPPGGWTAHPSRVTAPVDEQPTYAEVRPTQVIAPPRLRRVRAMARSALARLAHHTLRAGYHLLRTVPGARQRADRMKRQFLTWMKDPTPENEERRRVVAIRQEIAAVPAGLPDPPIGSGAPASRSIELFLDLQRARVVLRISEILQFYRSKMPGVVCDFPVLTRVDACIREAGIEECAIEERLRRLLDHAPDFAEGWYELGDLRLGNQDPMEAIACFDRCLTANPALAPLVGRTSCHVLAASAKAAALERSGALETAAETYRRAADLGEQPTLVRVAHARLLRRLGRARSAAAEFEAGMASDGTVVGLAPMPHDFARVAQRLVQVFREKAPADRVSFDNSGEVLPGVSATAR